MKYQCATCGMSVHALHCGQCGSELQHRSIKDKQGKEVQVAECPKECGKIKSPTCCNHDMEVKI